jgi:hypothetical protein
MSPRPEYVFHLVTDPAAPAGDPDNTSNLIYRELSKTLHKLQDDVQRVLLITVGDQTRSKKYEWPNRLEEWFPRSPPTVSFQSPVWSKLQPDDHQGLRLETFKGSTKGPLLVCNRGVRVTQFKLASLHVVGYPPPTKQGSLMFGMQYLDEVRDAAMAGMEKLSNVRLVVNFYLTKSDPDSLKLVHRWCSDNGIRMPAWVNVGETRKKKKKEKESFTYDGDMCPGLARLKNILTAAEIELLQTQYEDLSSGDVDTSVEVCPLLCSASRFQKIKDAVRGEMPADLLNLLFAPASAEEEVLRDGPRRSRHVADLRDVIGGGGEDLREVIGGGGDLRNVIGGGGDYHPPQAAPMGQRLGPLVQQAPVMHRLGSPVQGDMPQNPMFDSLARVKVSMPTSSMDMAVRRPSLMDLPPVSRPLSPFRRRDNHQMEVHGHGFQEPSMSGHPGLNRFDMHGSLPQGQGRYDEMQAGNFDGGPPGSHPQRWESRLDGSPTYREERLQIYEVEDHGIHKDSMSMDTVLQRGLASLPQRDLPMPIPRPSQFTMEDPIRDMVVPVERLARLGSPQSLLDRNDQYAMPMEGYGRVSPSPPMRRSPPRRSFSPTRRFPPRRTISPNRRSPPRRTISPNRRPPPRRTFSPTRRSPPRRTFSPTRRSPPRRKISPPRMSPPRRQLSPRRRSPPPLDRLSPLPRRSPPRRQISPPRSPLRRQVSPSPTRSRSPRRSPPDRRNRFGNRELPATRTRHGDRKPRSPSPQRGALGSGVAGIMPYNKKVAPKKINIILERDKKGYNNGGNQPTSRSAGWQKLRKNRNPPETQSRPVLIGGVPVSAEKVITSPNDNFGGNRALQSFASSWFGSGGHPEALQPRPQQDAPPLMDINLGNLPSMRQIEQLQHHSNGGYSPLQQQHRQQEPRLLQPPSLAYYESPSLAAPLSFGQSPPMQRRQHQMETDQFGGLQQQEREAPPRDPPPPPAIKLGEQPKNPMFTGASKNTGFSSNWTTDNAIGFSATNFGQLSSSEMQNVPRVGGVFIDMSAHQKKPASPIKEEPKVEPNAQMIKLVLSPSPPPIAAAKDSPAPPPKQMPDNLTLAAHFCHRMTERGRSAEIGGDMMLTWRLVGHSESTLRELCRLKDPETPNQLRILLMRELFNAKNIPNTVNVSEVVDETVEYFMPYESDLKKPVAGKGSVQKTTKFEAPKKQPTLEDKTMEFLRQLQSKNQADEKKKKKPSASVTKQAPLDEDAKRYSYVERIASLYNFQRFLLDRLRSIPEMAAVSDERKNRTVEDILRVLAEVGVHQESLSNIHAKFGDPAVKEMLGGKLAFKESDGRSGFPFGITPRLIGSWACEFMRQNPGTAVVTN